MRPVAGAARSPRGHWVIGPAARIGDTSTEYLAVVTRKQLAHSPLTANRPPHVEWYRTDAHSVGSSAEERHLRSDRGWWTAN